MLSFAFSGGFTVTHAQGEGILAAGLGRELTGISISHSAVVHNDRARRQG